MPWRECSNSTMYQASSGGTQATRGSNSNNNNNNGAIIMIKVIARVHPVHLMHADWAPGGHQPSEQANRLGLSPLSAIAIVPVPKAVYRSGYRDKHNHPRCDSNLGPLTSQSDVLNTRPLQPAVCIKQTRPASWNSLSPCSHILLGRVSVSV